MNCKCGKKPVYYNNGTYLCKNHFINYFEKKVYKTIRKHTLINPNDKVCVAASGGKDSIATLYLVSQYCEKQNIEYFALAIDEGIKGYRNNTLKDLKNFCKKHKIKLEIASFKKSFGQTLDKMMKKSERPCIVCGIMRRKLLNKTSRELGASKLVTGHNIDDEAQTYLMNLLKGNMGLNAKMGPVSGIIRHEKFIPRVKPLYYMTEQETRLFCLLKGFKVEFTECPNINKSFRNQVRDELNKLEEGMPGGKYGIVKSFMELMPTLKSTYKEKSSLQDCEKCGEPTTSKVCNACLTLEVINNGVNEKRTQKSG